MKTWRRSSKPAPPTFQIKPQTNKTTRNNKQKHSLTWQKKKKHNLFASSMFSIKTPWPWSHTGASACARGGKRLREPTPQSFPVLFFAEFFDVDFDLCGFFGMFLVFCWIKLLDFCSSLWFLLFGSDCPRNVRYGFFPGNALMSFLLCLAYAKPPVDCEFLIICHRSIKKSLLRYQEAILLRLPQGGAPWQWEIVADDSTKPERLQRSKHFTGKMRQVKIDVVVELSQRKPSDKKRRLQ